MNLLQRAILRHLLVVPFASCNGLTAALRCSSLATRQALRVLCKAGHASMRTTHRRVQVYHLTDAGKAALEDAPR